jgi:hypothetical protein
VRSAGGVVGVRGVGNSICQEKEVKRNVHDEIEEFNAFDAKNTIERSMSTNGLKWKIQKTQTELHALRPNRKRYSNSEVTILLVTKFHPSEIIFGAKTLIDGKFV